MNYSNSKIDAEAVKMDNINPLMEQSKKE